MKKYTYLYSTLAIFLFAFHGIKAQLKERAKAIIIEQYSFEKETDIHNWKTKKGALSVSKAHAKEGSHSLLWEWKRNDALAIENLEGLTRAASKYKGGTPEHFEPSFYPEDYYGGLKIWLYQEAPVKGNLTFAVGNSVKDAKSNPKYQFEVNLNFKGWRTVWVNLEEDAKVPGYKGSAAMKSLVITPTNTKVKQHKIYIDHISLLDFVSYKRHSDLVFENNKKDVRVDSYEILAPYKAYTNARFSDENFDATSLEKEVATISTRLEYLMLGNGTTTYKKRKSGLEQKTKSVIKSSHAAYKKLNLINQNGVIKGESLFSGRDEHGNGKGFEFQKVSQNTMFGLALDYRLFHNKKAKQKLVDEFKYFNDQGWAAGSAFGSVDHVIRLNGVAQSAFLIKDDLKAAGILEENIEALVWHSRLGEILEIDYSKAENTDKVRGGALVKLSTILMMENSPKKEAFLKAFQAYMDFVIAIAPGYGDTIKSDFSIFHHRGTYLNTYGIQAVNTMAMIHWLLEGTPYALSENSTEILKKAILKQSDIAFGEDLHYGVCGRFPSSNHAISNFLLPAYAFMSAKGNTIADTEMAGRFSYLYDITKPTQGTGVLFPGLTYSGTVGTIDLMVTVKEQFKAAPSVPKPGNYTMPYSSMSVHRTEKGYAAVKGYSKYVWDFETGSSKGENSLGRYLSHGAMYVFQTDPKDGYNGANIGFDEGYHTGYLPGATTKELPIEKVYFVNKSTPKYKEGYHRSYAETTFANGLSQLGENGIYAMELRDDVGPDPEKILFDNSFRAYKSYFFLGNEIVCLGSDISNNDAQYNTITTLFQYKQVKGNATDVNEKSIGEAEVHTTVDKGIVKDQNGIYYLIPNASEVRIEQGKQKSLVRKGKKYIPTNNAFTKAFISHGKSPKNKGYEYQILLNASDDEASEKLKEKSYEVLSQSKMCHAIYHKSSNTTSYAIYSEKYAFESGPLLAVDTPLLAMFKEEGTKAVLTVANPDLGLVKWNHNMSVMPEEITFGEHAGKVVKVTLKGNWHVAGYAPELVRLHNENGNTIFEVFTKEGKSIDLRLQKK